MHDSGGNAALATYRYRAVHRETGLSITERADIQELHVFLEEMDRQGYIVTSLKRVGWLESFLRSFVPVSRTSQRNKALALIELSAFLKAGIPLRVSLEYMSSELNPAVSRVLKLMAKDIERGLEFHEALRAHGQMFEPWEVEAVRASEASGNLADVLEYTGKQALRSSDFQDKVRSAMVYPLLILVVTTAVILLLLTFVVPTFAGLFGSVEKLPPATRLIVRWSGFLSKYWPLVIVAILGVWLFLKYLRSREETAARFERLLLRIPVWGKFLQSSYYARFSRTFSMLLRSGVPVLQSFEYAGQASGSYILRDATQAIRKEVERGSGIGDAMRDSGAFPLLLCELASAGENTGSLAEMISNACSFYEGEVERLLGTLSSLVEPALILVIGVIVGLVALAVFGPVLEALNVVM